MIGTFERYLSAWVGLAIVAGLALGSFVAPVFGFLAGLEYGSVNFPVAILIWAMVYPMMVGVDFASIARIRDRPEGLAITLVVNWLIKPFTMAALAILFFRHLYAGLIDPAATESYIAGAILLGAAPCTAMVFVWSQLTRGDPGYTLVQVAVNDLVMVVAFAPLVAFLLGVSDIAVPWDTLLLSVVLYVVIPLAAGIATRRRLVRGAPDPDAAVAAFTARLKPLSMAGLLATVVLLFGFQGEIIIDQPFLILLVAVPLILQSYGIFFIAWWGARWLNLPHDVAGPACLLGTSNFFELAVAVAISLFGLNSGAALATVVGVLVEVPVMLSLVTMVNAWRPAPDATLR